ncbi:MAG: hypothetical protein PWP03_807 [Candidatus Woesearchaeota archaeon]|nr:hypothetical protein [Candidatus Woesearchaeota archaeon]MDN5328169.1 hypothetical protein [Candidatus Woesearchaeota archaeon]
MLKPKQKEELVINIQPFEDLTRETIENSIKLIDYFKFNLIYLLLVSGKGLDFEQIQAYTLGDDPRRIDWKVYARTRQLMVRKFKEERTFDVIIALDVSNSMLLGTTEYTKNQFAALAAGSLAFAATEANDNPAIAMFSDKVRLFLDPDNDFSRILNVLSDKNNYGGKKSWGEFTNLLIGNYDSQSILFIISDFIDTDVTKFIPELSAYFSKVYGIMVRDPIEEKLPKGIGRVYIKDPDGNTVYLIDAHKVAEEYEMLCKREIERIKEAFHEAGQLFFKVNLNERFDLSFFKAFGAEEVELS